MVNTFLVDEDFRESAKKLDNRRLGKQRVEAYQILNLIENIRILSVQSGIRCMGDFQVFIREIKKWYQKKPFVYILSGEFLIEHLKQGDEHEEWNKNKITVETGERVIKMGFCNHPIVEMWFGYEDALKEYIDSHIDEWKARGYKNTMKRYGVKGGEKPVWCSWKKFHDNHKGALINKEVDREEKIWYQKMDDFVVVKEDYVDYIWVKNKIVYVDDENEIK
jgi:hypothetical protein